MERVTMENVAMEISSHVTYRSQGRKDLLEKENALRGLFN